MKYAGLVLLSLSLAITPAVHAQDSDRGVRRQARHDAAVARIAARSRPAAVQPRAARMPQAQPGMARIPQQRAFNPNRGIGRSGAAFDADASVQPRMRPRIYNTPAVEQRVFTPPTATNTPLTATNTAATVEQTTPRSQVEPRAGATDGTDRRGFRPRDWRNRGSGTNEIQTRTGDSVDPTVQNATTTADRERSEHRRGNWRERHREWHDRHEGDPDFADKHRRFHRQHYNREWWRRNYSRFVLFGGGYYYWNRGYWYPAYGYDPYYSTYIYDGPIYSYDGLSPAQVVGRVQAALQRRGYYRGAVDGTFGPATRQALMNYQADVGLPMTGEIDEDTLNSLELE